VGAGYCAGCHDDTDVSCGGCTKRVWSQVVAGFFQRVLPSCTELFFLVYPLPDVVCIVSELIGALKTGTATKTLFSRRPRAQANCSPEKAADQGQLPSCPPPWLPARRANHVRGVTSSDHAFVLFQVLKEEDECALSKERTPSVLVIDDVTPVHKGTAAACALTRSLVRGPPAERAPVGCGCPEKAHAQMRLASCGPPVYASSRRTGRWARLPAEW
jgi:hypothetical protein